jgi:hypothetical protein
MHEKIAYAKEIDTCNLLATSITKKLLNSFIQAQTTKTN